jgi:hypothetical protein
MNPLVARLISGRCRAGKTLARKFESESFHLKLD